MRSTAPLNERQIQVLRWIADQCPPDVMTGYSHKTTARALQARQLVKVSNRDAGWSATVTDRGSYYLQHGSFPLRRTVPPAPRAPSRVAPDPVSNEQAGQTAGNAATAVAAAVATVAKPVKLSPTEQLVVDVLAAGGTLEVPQGRVAGYDVGYRMAQLARQANRHGKTPPGQRLVHRVVRDGDGWYGERHDLIVLEDGPQGTDVPLLPVPVPEQVNRYHPAVSALRKASRVETQPDEQTRAFRVLHAIAVEAEHRGFNVSAHTPKSANGRASRTTAWHLLVKRDDETVPLRITEEDDRVEHTPTARELAEHQRKPWMSIPSHDQVPSGRLRIDLGGPSDTERKSFWADRASWSLEEKLPELLREIAVRADELRLRREAQAHAAAQHRQAVEQEEQRAHARAAEAHRQEVLERQLGRWREVRELREYLTALSERIDAAEAATSADDAAIADAHQWVQWITDYADRRDPAKTLPTWPASPKLRSYELSKFMNHVVEPVEVRYRPETY